MASDSTFRKTRTSLNRCSVFPGQRRTTQLIFFYWPFLPIRLDRYIVVFLLRGRGSTQGKSTPHGVLKSLIMESRRQAMRLLYDPTVSQLEQDPCPWKVCQYHADLIHQPTLSPIFLGACPLSSQLGLVIKERCVWMWKVDLTQCVEQHSQYDLPPNTGVWLPSWLY